MGDGGLLRFNVPRPLQGYPVIVQVYGGPGSALVEKTWNAPADQPAAGVGVDHHAFVLGRALERAEALANPFAQFRQFLRPENQQGNSKYQQKVHRGQQFHRSLRKLLYSNLTGVTTLSQPSLLAGPGGHGRYAPSPSCSLLPP